jgi:toxin CcdB
VARFDVYRNPNRKSRERVPLLLDVQADLLSGLSTRLVVPLVRAAEFSRPAEKLNPVLRIEGRNYVLSTAEMAAIPVKALGERITSVQPDAPAILGAVDFLISGI